MSWWACLVMRWRRSWIKRNLGGKSVENTCVVVLFSMYCHVLTCDCRQAVVLLSEGRPGEKVRFA